MTFEPILRDHVVRYPLMQVEDAYKLVHQACMGSEHAVSDLDGVRRWMAREVAEMGDGPNDPLIDPISPDGRIARVHLRPYLAAGYDPACLLDAFVQTANGYRGSIEHLRRTWHDVVALARAGALPFDAQRLDELGQSMAAQGFPAIHHSPAYERAYRPAYRVVARAYLLIPA